MPDFQAIATAYGIKSHTVTVMDEILDRIKPSLSNDESELTEIILTESKNRLEPRMVIGRPMEDMYPHLESEELENLMFINPVED